MKGLSLWGFIFVVLFGQVAFANGQLKCSLIESDDSLTRKNITLFTNDKKLGDPSFKIITIKREENEITALSYTQPVETFSKCSTNNEDFVFKGKHTPRSSTACQKNGAIHADPEGGPFNVRKLERAGAWYSPNSGSWLIDYEFAWLHYSVGGQELIGLSVAGAERGKYACY